MNIAIIQSAEAVAKNGGVRVQGVMWGAGLKGLGHHVDLINFWENHEWNDYDAIIVLAVGQMFPAIVNHLNKCHVNIVIAPILDPTVSIKRFKFMYKYWNFRFLRLYSEEFFRHRGMTLGNWYLARSVFEKTYISEVFNIPKDRISVVPLSFRTEPINYFPDKMNFCFHASRLYDRGKNVERLILAAKKYNFRLVLAGFLHGDVEKKWLCNLIDGAPNIEYVGVLTDSELIEFYKKAKVFALPSFVEGVGMVALEAASYGCEIVLTKLGAPKEYYDGQAVLVDPKSIDEIGESIVKCLSDGYAQPKLQKFVLEKYSLRECSIQLEKALQESIRCKLK
jgi:glycosyltransferase involved in cell wall biosynthesis